MCKSPKLETCFISMDSFTLFESFYSADEGKSSASDSALRGITDVLEKKTSLERPAVSVSGESRYLTQLWVFGNRDPWEELHPPDKSRLSLEPRAEETAIQYHEIKDKIRAVLKLLTFREQEIIVQFWSPQVVGKHRLLTTVDQPFGVSAVDKYYLLYRKDSECNPFLVNKDHEEEDSGPPARVYRRGLPEWTSNIKHYKPKDFPLGNSAMNYEFYGYLALPVFDSTTSFALMVPHFQAVNLQKMNLTTPQTFDHPTSNVPSDQKQNRMDKIHSILKAVCDIHDCSIGQTWAVSPLASYVAHEDILQKACSSFNTKCIGKVCMSTSGLPFYVTDPDTWHFREACREQHLEKTSSIVGRALVTHGSCFCRDVSELSEKEYPLVYYARMSCVKGCFTIFLRSLEGDGDEYVLEFFRPWSFIESTHMLLVDLLKHIILVDSGFELGDVSSIEEVEASKGDKNLSLDIEPRIIPTSSTSEANTLLQTSSSDSEPIVANVVDSTVVPSRSPTEANTLLETGSSESEPIVSNVNKSAVVPSRSPIEYAHGNETFIDAGINTHLKQGKKRKRDSLTLEAVQQQFGMPIGQAAESLGFSRSTLKRFCREHNIPSWPMTSHNKNDRQLPNAEIAHGSPTTNVVNVMDMNMLTVKASFKEHMIRFSFPVSSGLLELENEVARRIKLEGDTKVFLKYKDEEGDWILVACDADLHSVIGFLGSNTTLKLIVELSDI